MKPRINKVAAQSPLPSAFPAVAKCFLLLLVSWQFSASARASQIDGIDCITAYDVAGDNPLQIADSSSDLPDLPSKSANLTADKESIPSRPDQGPAQFPGGSFAAAGLSSLGVAPLLLLSPSSSSCLSTNIHERAPPNLV